MKYLQLGSSFKITNRGYVYICNIAPDYENFKLHEKFYDYEGNEYIISGIEMFRMLNEFNPIFDNRFPLLIKNEKSYDIKVKGKILSSEKNTINVSFIFPSNPLDFNAADFDYMEEYNASKNNFDTMLFSYEDLVNEHRLKINKKIPGLAIYRGWMLKPWQYKELYELLAKENIYLINSPDDYERCHLLPNWYKRVKSITPKSCWTNSNDLEDAFELLKEFNGPIMVKDYVKSRKHEWDDACYIENPNSDKAKEVIKNFIDRQESEFVGGTVLREYVNLKRVGYHEISGMPISDEYRVFVLYDEIISIVGYWGNTIKNFNDDEMTLINKIMSRINSNFYTIDLARKENGDLIVIEIGDGQVSGLQGLNVDEFYEVIFKIIY